jgi:hypothetical protein
MMPIESINQRIANLYEYTNLVYHNK